MPTDDLDLDFRPTSYFAPGPAATELVMSIRGAARRRIAAAAAEAGTLAELPPVLLQPALDPGDLVPLARVNPVLLGGETLPEPEDGEVEIASIFMWSVLGDVASVMARPDGDRIAYRVVDEYDGMTLETRRTRASREPLRLRELVDFFLGAWDLRHVLFGLNFFDNETDAQRFVCPSSEFYPGFEAAVRARITAWYAPPDSARNRARREANPRRGGPRAGPARRP